MIYNYAPLWRQLERKNLSKTELRKQLVMSTSTLAKLSAGNAVSLDLLARIAKLLECSLDDLVSLHDSDTILPWKDTISAGRFYLRMLFEPGSEKAVYLFGYAIAVSMPTRDMKQWTLSTLPEEPEIFLLEGYVDDECLRDLIAGAENRKSIGEFLKDARISLMSKSDDIAAKSICKAAVCNCPSVSFFTWPLISSLPSAKAAHSSGLATTMLWALVCNATTPMTKTANILAVGNFIDSFFSFVIFHSLPDDSH